MPRTAHLRWFILDGAPRGSGLARRLLAEPLAHARKAGFARVHLRTLAGLPVAARLCAEAGFRLEEVTGQQWGWSVTERRLGLRTCPAPTAAPDQPGLLSCRVIHGFGVSASDVTP